MVDAARTPLSFGVKSKSEFAVYSSAADQIDLCFIQPDESIASHPLSRDGDIWKSTDVPFEIGQRYFLRVTRDGSHYSVADPYARLMPDAPLCALPDTNFDWDGVLPPDRPWKETVIYETHVKGFSIRHPQILAPVRGTYLGLASKPAIDHLLRLGVTAIQLMPVHQKRDEPRLHELGLTNYWGYSSIGYFAPDVRFASDPMNAVAEFKTMVRELHRAGIEVILDVVFNHTAEGGEHGPTLCFRGLDPSTYYRMNGESAVDFTGCGNTINIGHPVVLNLVIDSLCYWRREMHVDGFRFDLAPVLGRTEMDYDPRAPFFEAVAERPELRNAKLIAEPWDLGPAGYQQGNFPLGWRELNGRFRDDVRSFWNVPGGGDVGAIATRIAGSSDLFLHNGRNPSASINFITSHDGFSLLDLVSYSRKRNEANGESNRDGTDDDRSWNCGVEGNTRELSIRKLRLQQRKNFVATMFLSLGVPFLSGGDELSQTHGGNNNCYCHDSELNWYSWEPETPFSEEHREFLEFVSGCACFRRSHPQLQREDFYSAPDADSGVRWYGIEGQPLFDGSNGVEETFFLMSVPREGVLEPLIFVFNGRDSDTVFRMPEFAHQMEWSLMMDTARSPSFLLTPLHLESPMIRARSIWILRGLERLHG